MSRWLDSGQHAAYSKKQKSIQAGVSMFVPTDDVTLATEVSNSRSAQR